jgi:hypothetical protein
MEILKEEQALPTGYKKIENKNISDFFKNIIFALSDMWRELVEKVNPVIKGAVFGDGTMGRTLRIAELIIEDGTNTSTIKVSLDAGSNFNGDTINAEDNLGKNGSTTSFALSLSGAALTIKATALSGNAVGAFATLDFNGSQTSVAPLASISGNDIVVEFTDASETTDAGNDVDLTILTDTGQIKIGLFYITNA